MSNSIVWIKNNLFIHSAVDGNLNCFPFLVLLNKTTMTIPVHVFWRTTALLSLSCGSKTGAMHCKVGLGITLYTVCSSFLPRTKAANRVSGSREGDKVLVSSMSGRLVRGQKSRCWKDPRGSLMPSQLQVLVHFLPNYPCCGHCSWLGSGSSVSLTEDHISGWT